MFPSGEPLDNILVKAVARGLLVSTFTRSAPVVVQVNVTLLSSVAGLGEAENESISASGTPTTVTVTNLP